MSELDQPPTKKIKLQQSEHRLELSDPTEPLTQRDVIAFQKEAIFRCLNQNRTLLDSLKVKYEVTERDYNGIVSQISKIITIFFTLLNLIHSSSIFSSSILNDDERKLIENLLLNSKNDDDADSNTPVHLIIESSTQLMDIFNKCLSKDQEFQLDKNKLMQNLEKLTNEKSKLSLQNEKLNNQLTSLQTHYESLIKKYDRDDSITVKRVFSKEISNCKDVGPNVQEVNTQQQFASGTETKLEQKGGLIDSTIQANNNIALSPKGDVEGQQENSCNVTNGDSLSDDKKILQYEVKISDLENQIVILNDTLKSLEEIKLENENKIRELNTQVSQKINISISKDRFNSSISVDNSDRDMLMIKIDQLTKENKELTETNEQFLSKFQKLSSDQEFITNNIKEQFKASNGNLFKMNQSLEKDLTRIRTTRDELLSKLAILEKEKSKSELLTDLENVNKILTEQWKSMEKRNSTYSSDSPDKQSLLKEIQDMEMAFKDVSTLLNKKYIKLSNSESTITKLSVEKTKADQKYFAAMRSKDSILIENKNILKKFNKINDLILQLKDNEIILTKKIENLQKQLNFSQLNEKGLINKNKTISTNLVNLNSEINNLKKINSNLNQLNLTQANDLTKLNSLMKSIEMENKKLTSKNGQLEKTNMKLSDKLFKDNKSNNINGGNNTMIDTNQNEELENFRQLVYCSLCSKNWKNMAIKTCGHVFCQDCCKERLAARMRKCPTCNNPFGSNDLMAIHL
ncbi:E3 ubiquitin-protein ligase BRE1 NDAI_0D04300 [Naumovozyma dairenensis CBS 421]|uniref:E3 ubiquitin protein ligase n=1 Tax=Naumovozyma dairenensis (strain ATCC 10597 / BCRC 20456 / CBS 421 / NBRC 0211 / NRRL Y-12639) TaxID=1071378 RepID=G0WAD3_NAUDC|nr:hypothetical protein NDAI_0D04300 [Naumovozyma dairenensis CBS 421]CCD24744.1 hypothetical protein NDAI_0D04300 [Naumovozyma dairenensis CBS 421]